VSGARARVPHDTFLARPGKSPVETGEGWWGMVRRAAAAVTFVFWASGAAAQTADPAASPEAAAALLPRRLAASRIQGRAPVIDGRLDERDWEVANIATDFVQRRPQPGALASVRTEARVLYDDDALYVGVHAFEPAPETIVAPFPRRDDETTSDWVFVEFDTRHDRRSAVSFGLNPRGVQADGAFLEDVNWDPNWNAVWEGAAHMDATGWTAEYRIPFTQLVYAATDAEGETARSAPAVFGMNVYRYSPHRGESSNWSPRLPSFAGVVSHFNELHLRVPRHRRRLEIAPFASLRSGDAAASGARAAGGVDVRAGLGSAFTLAAAVRPDFGQVEADPSEVNLTTLETLFTERRPLFIENAGFFAFNVGAPFATRGNSFASEQAFYSRRIGRATTLGLPSGTRAVAVPAAADVLGAARLTGRTANGWSVGALAALTQSETARFRDATDAPGTRALEPAAEFAVARVTKDFRQGRSAVGSILSLVRRPGMTPELASRLPARSWAAGIDARHRFGSDEYEASGFALGTSVQGEEPAITDLLTGPGHFAQRPDRGGFAGGETRASGFAGQARLAKVGGEHWRWSVLGHALSPRLALNDVGFQRNADWLVALGSLTYQEDRPGRRFRRWSVGSSQIGGGWSFAGERRAAVANLTASADLRNYWAGSLSLDHEWPALQAEALRGGPALLRPARDAVALSVVTDTRRVSQLAMDVRAFREVETGSHQVGVAPLLNLRPADRLFLSVGPALDWATNGWQYVGAPAPAGEPHYILARLRQTTVSLTTRVDLAFSPRLTLQLYAQPFASAGRFDRYVEVVSPRAARTADRVRPIAPEAFATLPDPAFHVRDLHANLVLRWEYRPGSALFVVWSQQREATLAGPFTHPLGEVFGPFALRPADTVLVKLSYWFTPRR